MCRLLARAILPSSDVSDVDRKEEQIRTWRSVIAMAVGLSSPMVRKGNA